MTFPSGRLLRNISIAVRPVVRHGWYSDTSMTKYQDISSGMKSSRILLGSLRYFATAYWVSQ
jgi:hypothetical protein